jgi:hypothetical protein
MLKIGYRVGGADTYGTNTTCASCTLCLYACFRHRFRVSYMREIRGPAGVIRAGT